MQKKISYLEQERGQRSPSVATMAYIFLFSRVKYCPFHSQYVIYSFPYDRSMIRFKNVLWFTVARGGARFLSFSRLFRAPTNSSVGIARHKINALSNAIISKNYKSPWMRPRLIISPLTEIEWKRRRHRREDEFSEREKESRATLFTIDNFPRWRVIFPRIRSASGFSGIGFIRRSFYPSIIFFENFSEFWFSN